MTFPTLYRLAFQEHRALKCYLALVHGRVDRAEEVQAQHLVTLRHRPAVVGAVDEATRGARLCIQACRGLHHDAQTNTSVVQVNVSVLWPPEGASVVEHAATTREWLRVRPPSAGMGVGAVIGAGLLYRGLSC